MEQVNDQILNDETIYPDEGILESVLGNSYSAYRKLLDLFKENEMLAEWKYYKDGKAWLCKVQKKKRTILWMSAWKGFMKATIYFPERHVDSLLALEISDELKESIGKAKNIGKSKPCMFEIRNQKPLKDLGLVMKMKIDSDR